MSATLAAMLRKSTGLYTDRWVEQSKSSFKTPPRPELISKHTHYWDAIVRAVETADFEELMGYSRDAGVFQARSGMDLSDAIRRNVEATNMIELALLEANDGLIPPLDIINEIAELRSMIVMAVAEGYKLESDREKDVDPSAKIVAKERLAALLRNKSGAKEIALQIGEEITPLYDSGMRFYFVETGKLRLYNLLPNGRCITLSILGPNDVFLQWRAESASLSCLCAEAMAKSTVVAVSDTELADVIAQQPMAAIDVITNFARRMTESQVLIEDLLNNSVNLRLYRTLLELGKQFGKPDGAIDVPLTHQRLADMIGSNRVTVTRKLHELQDRGFIETRKGATIVILDASKLAELATSGAES